ncbi:MAG: hypothetical protein GC206_14765 [Alphaproteobacteria bacterium]|nr:hypothetical protein [Alphaproteobacteria bacterium]
MLRDHIRTPDGREARNEQRKLRAAIANAFAIAVGAVALFGQFLNPTAAEYLTPASRAGLVLLALALHLFAAWLVRDMEDR